jgi:5-methylcytosine-specific restriction endonuclease McrA
MVETFFKEKAHVKLKGKKYSDLIKFVMDRDGAWCCECGKAEMLSLSHIIHKKSGGGFGPGDVAENCVIRCLGCHVKEEHGQDGRVKK